MPNTHVNICSGRPLFCRRLRGIFRVLRQPRSKGSVTTAIESTIENTSVMCGLAVGLMRGSSSVTTAIENMIKSTIETTSENTNESTSKSLSETTSESTGESKRAIPGQNTPHAIRSPKDAIRSSSYRSTIGRCLLYVTQSKRNQPIRAVKEKSDRLHRPLTARPGWRT